MSFYNTSSIFAPCVQTVVTANVFIWPVAAANGFLQTVPLGRGASALGLFYFEAESLSYFYHSGLQTDMWRGFIKHPELSVRHDWMIDCLVGWMNEWMNVYSRWRKLVALLLQVCQHDFTLYSGCFSFGAGELLLFIWAIAVAVMP